MNSIFDIRASLDAVKNDLSSTRNVHNNQLAELCRTKEEVRQLQSSESTAQQELVRLKDSISSCASQTMLLESSVADATVKAAAVATERVEQENTLKSAKDDFATLQVDLEDVIRRLNIAVSMIILSIVPYSPCGESHFSQFRSFYRRTPSATISKLSIYHLTSAAKRSPWLSQISAANSKAS